MALVSIIGYAYYMKPPSPEQAPEVKITESAYAALGESNPSIAITYAYKRPIWNTTNGNPTTDDTFLDESGELVIWGFEYLDVKADIFN